VTTAVRTPPNHDTLNCTVTYNCQQPECLERRRTYERNRRRDLAAGIHRLVDAEPVRQHILTLKAVGMTDFRIGTLAGIPARTVTGFTKQQYKNRGQLVGRRNKTTPRIAQAILAVTPDPAMATRVNAAGSARRIQALVAAGWPQTHIARHAGVSETTLKEATRHPVVMATTANGIKAAYAHLRMRQPSRTGVSAREANAARARAAANRWAPPKYWDHPDHPIDDPDFEPQTVGQAIAEEARWLMQVGGLDLAQAAKRLRRSCSYVNTCLTDHPEDREAAA